MFPVNRPVAYLVIFGGVVLLLFSGYDQYRGIAEVTPPSRSALLPIIVNRSDDPQQFCNLMSYKWGCGSLVVLLGFVFLGICRRADRVDPFSPDFEGQESLDELKKTLDEEERRRKRPLR